MGSPSPLAQTRRVWSWPLAKADTDPGSPESGNGEDFSSPRTVATDIPVSLWQRACGSFASSEDDGSQGGAGAAGKRRRRRRPKRRQPVPPAPPNVPLRRPCLHNSWDMVRVRKAKCTLRCRKCQLQWKTDHQFVVDRRCNPFSSRAERCRAGPRCGLMHIHPYKQSLTKRRQIWGEQLGGTWSSVGGASAGTSGSPQHSPQLSSSSEAAVSGAASRRRSASTSPAPALRPPSGSGAAPPQQPAGGLLSPHSVAAALPELCTSGLAGPGPELLSPAPAAPMAGGAFSEVAGASGRQSLGGPAAQQWNHPIQLSASGYAQRTADLSLSVSTHTRRSSSGAGLAATTPAAGRRGDRRLSSRGSDMPFTPQASESQGLTASTRGSGATWAGSPRSSTAGTPAHRISAASSLGHYAGPAPGPHERRCSSRGGDQLLSPLGAHATARGSVTAWSAAHACAPMLRRNPPTGVVHNFQFGEQQLMQMLQQPLQPLPSHSQAMLPPDSRRHSTWGDCAAHSQQFSAPEQPLQPLPHQEHQGNRRPSSWGPFNPQLGPTEQQTGYSYPLQAIHQHPGYGAVAQEQQQIVAAVGHEQPAVIVTGGPHTPPPPQ